MLLLRRILSSAVFITLELIFIIMLVAVQLVIMFFTIYQVVISLLGLIVKRRQPEMKSNKINHFALVVAAHNEEAVVGQIVENLKNLQYPVDAYDIYVLCDNCTDHTADVVREHGGIAMERNQPHLRGKGHGLEWIFAQLWDLEKNENRKYDAVAMFDADNLVSHNFLTLMNRKLNQGYEVIQGYLDTKNPSDSWVTKSYAFAYWSTNQIFQLARENLGLSAQLGGTGVVVTSDILKEIGWGATSLTEDLEFTARYVLQTGRRVAWEHEARIYDEKPIDFRTTWKQRIRWMQGHSNCMVRYGPRLLWKAIRDGSMIAFDVAIYLTQPARTLLSLASLCFLVLSIISNIFEYRFMFLSPRIWAAIVILYFSLPVVGLIKEGKWKAVTWYIPTYLFSLTWIPITFIGFVKRNQRIWSHTKHNRILSSEEALNILKTKEKAR